ncbi:hypothetical protein E2K98_12330 [Bacillus salipaludis]|uniref:Uncharacterized protein n=1 Tax=Bacillus salipaludis TaxID=2547811 RepID=A0A4R5VUC3_9BACI|nr:hypothetical protein [Bacillus salipaludis]MDQ6599702.1 hypothetical protein [Bacillus salipaludis]TDK61672.1 hypothetical protein E2K98_12330 [Bacillus salipaludis]
METIIFLIIIGVLSSVFGKAKANRTPSKNKSFTFNQFDEFREIFSEKVTPKQVKSINRIEEPTVTPRNIEINYDQIKQEAESITTGVSRVHERQRVEDLKPQALDKEDHNELISDSPDAQTLINGIIWSEILGAPRAKRPFYSRRR